MSNRFSHLKNKEKDAGKFIEGANEEKRSQTARPKKDQKDILLSISSRMNRDEECKKPVLLHLKKDVVADIEKHCHGNKQAILNYLLRRGLDAIIKDSELILL